MARVTDLFNIDAEFGHHALQVHGLRETIACVLQWCYSGVTVVLQEFYRVTVRGGKRRGEER
jgi:hypothetical protein